MFCNAFCRTTHSPSITLARRCGGGFVASLLAACLLAVSLAALPAPALAQAVTGVDGGNGVVGVAGGNGGASGDGSAGGAGGLDDGTPHPGGDGSAGAGGVISNPAGGTIQGGNGGNGSGGGGGGGAGIGGGGGGGDGGGFGGGGGGAGHGGGGGGGGAGGGAGGAGGAMSGALTLTNSGTIAGGNGGSGDNANHAGNGGDGIGNGGSCVGSFHCGSGGAITGAITLNNQAGGVVQGGNGAGNVAGGAGVRGANVSIVNDGTISGGLNGDGTQADAIVFTGGTNSLELWSNSTITGNVVAVSGGSDTLILGGSDDSDIQLGDIGPGQQYQNFANFEKTGTSNWTLNGTTTVAMPWTVSAGVLVLGSGSSMGAASTVQVNAGATLAVMGPAPHTLQSLTNNGTVILEGDTTVGAYTGGSGSALDIPAQLNGGGALAELTVTNTVSGVTAVNIINFDPSVALTTGNGMPLITLPAGAPAGSFVLGSVTDTTLAPITGYDFKLTQAGNALFLQILAQGAASTTSVPTLNTWALGLLALLLFAFAAGGVVRRRAR